jgi:hypothetical protein
MSISFACCKDVCRDNSISEGNKMENYGMRKEIFKEWLVARMFQKQMIEPFYPEITED